jgi:hypothetical protein
MPRRPRLVIAGVPLHITQRGVNRAATFLDAEDKRLCHELLVELVAFERGSPCFQAMVARTLNRPVAVRPRGRPRATVWKESNK